MRPPEELLYESEASFRLVDHALEELNATGADLDRQTRGFLEHVMANPGGFAELSRTLLRAYAEAVAIVVRLRESCGMIDTSSGTDKLQQMHGRLNEVSSATETATHSILDAVARAVTLTEQLDTASDTERPKVIATLKEELGDLTNHLQFQDITAQQISHIGSLLNDMRHSISQIVSVFAPGSMPVAPADPSVHMTYDPNASTQPRTDQQAMADEIFAGTQERKTA